MAQSTTGICNRALQMVGASQQILNLTDNTREARALTRAYEPCRRSELRSHVWNFAIRRQRLAMSVDTPAFGPMFQFPLPVDCLRVLVPKGASCHWAVEGRNVVSDDVSPIDVRYVADIEDPTQFDAMFCEMLSLRIAVAIVEDITGSNTKKAGLEQDYMALVRDARQVDALEGRPQTAEESGWVTARSSSSASDWG